MNDGINEFSPRLVREVPSFNAIVAADITVSGRFKNIKEKGKGIIRRFAAHTALTASALSLIVSSGCGNTENSSRTINLESSPASASLLPATDTTIAQTPELVPISLATPSLERSIEDMETNSKIEIVSPKELSEVVVARMRRPDPVDGSSSFVFLPYPDLLDKKFLWLKVSCQKKK